MNKQNKAIEEMAKIIGFSHCGVQAQHRCTVSCDICIAKQLYNAGYKQEKETAREILSWAERVAKPTYYNVDDNPRMESIVLLSDIYKLFKEKHGVEVK